MNWLYLLFFGGFFFSLSEETHAQARICNQTDQVAQARRQIEGAIAQNNTSLIRRILTVSPYADVNDRSACGNKGYMGCAMAGKLDVIKLLFSLGYDSNWRVNPQLDYFFVNAFSIPKDKDDFVVAAYGVFLENGAHLDAEITASAVQYNLFNPYTVLQHVMWLCAGIPTSPSSRGNRLIKTTIEKQPIFRDDAIEALVAIHEALIKNRGPDAANCAAMIDWMQTQ
jgi:hypothetical protein